jgi:hypothetical protein
MSTRQSLLDWIATERALYADVKYAADGPNRAALIADLRDHPHIDGEWDVFIGNYLRRAQLFGVDSLPGRQALGKTIVTLMHCLETAIEAHGPMPVPGVPSGEIVS